MTRRPIVCLVTDRHALAPGASDLDATDALDEFLGEAIAAGVDLIQIRERDLEAVRLLELARRAVSRAAGTTTRVVLNDRVDIGVAAGVHGVHLRGDGPPAARVRALLPPDALVGRSVHVLADVSDAADYFLFGAVFPSGGKPVNGLEGLAAAVRGTAAPVLAVGGVTPANAAACRAAGAAGVAAISVFLPPGRTPTSLGPAAAVEAFLAVWNP